MSKPNLSGHSPAEVKQINRNIDRESPRQLESIREDAARTAKVQQEAETEGLERLGEALKPKASPFKPSIKLRDSKW
ncbi:hypothetical protein [Methylobacterium sp. Leaf123]|uniref:hypothetical protein n=1 Tax=Methylobacterium sp. Leaf123 TaxID=1736264 RepID=UPI0012E7797D|nr:hypothetical protein [Methylobacterium sp. Leaf123]